MSFNVLYIIESSTISLTEVFEFLIGSSSIPSLGLDPTLNSNDSGIII